MDRFRGGMPWRVERAQEQYRRRVTTGLKNPNSRVHRKLIANLSEGEIAKLIKDIESLDLKEDRAMRNLVRQFGEPVQGNLRRFTQACYHVVGTSVVNCETGTDLVELSDFRVDEMTDSEIFEKENLLSDTNIFLLCCFATAMNAINEMVVPAFIVDALSFDVLARARQALAEQGFQQKYDEVVSDFLKRIASADAREALETWDAEKTVRLAKELSEHFARYLQTEIPEYRKAIQQWHQSEAIRAGADTVKGLGEMAVGEIPGVGVLISLFNLSHSAFEAGEHAAKAIQTKDFAFADQEARRRRDEQVDRVLATFGLKNRTTISNALQQLRELAALSLKPN